VTAVFLTGFDSGGIENAKSSGGTFSLQQSIVRHTALGENTYALRVNPTTTALGFVGFGTVAATTGLPAFFPVQSYFTRFYFRVDTAPASGSEQIMSCRSTSGNQNWAIRLDSARKLSLYNSANALVTTGATVLTLGVWYRLEVSAGNNGAGSAHLLDINGTNEWNTTATQGTLAGEYIFGKVINRSSQTIDVYYDDIVIDDSTLAGEGFVNCLSARTTDTVGGYDFLSGTGFSDQGEVQAKPINTARYIMCAASANHIGTFFMHPVATEGNVCGTIRGVMLTVGGIREDTSGTSNIKAQIKSGASVSTNSTALNATTATSNIAVLSTVDPATSTAWTRTSIDAATFGIVVGATNAIAVRASAVYVEVAGDYAAVASATTVTLTAATATATGGSSASASATTVTLSGPTATASGTSSGGATATADAPTITLTAPTAAATGDANTTASATTIALTAPDASATGDASASASATTIALAAATATATGDALADASATTITLTPPTATATGDTTPVVATTTAEPTGRIFVVPQRRIRVPVLREHPGIPVGKVRTEPASQPAPVAEPVAEAAPVARQTSAPAVESPARPSVSVDQRAREYAEAAMLAALLGAPAPVAASLTGPTFDLIAALTMPLEPMEMPLAAFNDDALIFEAIAIVDTLELEEVC
jgi:hypothetical protein